MDQNDHLEERKRLLNRQRATYIKKISQTSGMTWLSCFIPLCLPHGHGILVLVMTQRLTGVFCRKDRGADHQEATGHLCQTEELGSSEEEEGWGVCGPQT